MDSLKKECFFMAVKYLNFTEASGKMFMTQPAFSRQIALMEEEIGVQLFIRDKKRNVRLTPLGAMYYKGLKEITTDYEALIHKIQRCKRGMEGQLRIGILTGYFLPPVLRQFIADFQEKHPDIQLELRSGSFLNLRDWLEDGELDIAINLEVELSRESHFVSERLYREETYLVMAKGMPYDENIEYSIADFCGETFLTSEENHGICDLLQNIFRQANVEIPMKHVQTFDTLMLCIANGQGIAGCGVNHMMYYNPYVKYIPVREFEPQWFSAIWKKDNYNPLIAEFYMEYQKYNNFV